MTYTSIEDVEYEMHAIELVMLSMMKQYKELDKERLGFVQKIWKEEVYLPAERKKKRQSLCLCSYVKRNGRAVLLKNDNCPQHGK